MKKQRVLLVDDNLNFLAAASKIINNNINADLIGIANSGEEAIQKTVSEHPDIILMDLSMPGIGGLIATRVIKKIEDSPKVIILTVYDSAEYRIGAEDAGADGFISKSEFVDKIDEVFNKNGTFGC